MTNEEWLNYYDKNLATEVSEDVSPVAKELAELEEMKESLEAGEQIDLNKEQDILETILEEIESGKDVVSVEEEI